MRSRKNKDCIARNVQSPTPIGRETRWPIDPVPIYCQRRQLESIMNSIRHLMCQSMRKHFGPNDPNAQPEPPENKRVTSSVNEPERQVCSLEKLARAFVVVRLKSFDKKFVWRRPPRNRATKACGRTDL